MNTLKIDPPSKKALNFPKSPLKQGEKTASTWDATATTEASTKTATHAAAQAATKAAVKTDAKTAVTAPKRTKATTKKALKKPEAASAKSAPSSTTSKTKKPAGKPERAVAPALDPVSRSASNDEPAVKAGVSKAKRTKKEKVVRDSFTMPSSDYAKLATLKQKCLNSGVRVKKSELLRAALIMLDAAPEKRIVAAVKALETVKTGRPAGA